MATVQLTVFKSEQVYLDAEVFPINAGNELREEGIQLQVWDVWLHPGIGRNIWEKETGHLTPVFSGVLSCNQTVIPTASGEDLCGSAPARPSIHQHIDHAWSRRSQAIDKFKYGGDDGVNLGAPQQTVLPLAPVH